MPCTRRRVSLREGPSYIQLMMNDLPTTTAIADTPIAPEANAAAVIPHATGSAIPPDELERLTADIVAALKTVYDPEIPADIYELGLIYRVDIDDDRNVEIDMTLTAPGCPVAGEMPGWVENAVSLVAGVGNVTVNMVFDPTWTPDRMSDLARVALDWY
jgi:FeS assembly SUF system protein